VESQVVFTIISNDRNRRIIFFRKAGIFSRIQK